MRLVVTSCGLFVLLALVSVIQCSIISKNIRYMEVENALSSSADYAMDIIYSEYASAVLEDDGKWNIDKTDEQYKAKITYIMEKFCKAVLSRIGTDGRVTVMLDEADFQKGIFSFTLKEKFQYPFNNRTGICTINKAYKIDY